MSYQHILFDLDGTLTDPGEGITNSVSYALKKFNINVNNKKALYKFIGPPLIDSFMNFYNFSYTDAKKAVEYYREYFAPKGIFENKVYPDIPDLLLFLKNKGKKLYVATSKPEPFSISILEHFRLSHFFEFIGGSTMDETRVNKNEVIKYVIETNNICDLSSVVMIGDRKHDILGATDNNINSIGVLYGYGNFAELKQANATHIVSSVKEIENIII